MCRRSPGGAGGGPERGAVAQRGSGALSARARGCARRARACWREPRSRARPQRAQCPLVGGVVEPPVADETRLDGRLAAGCYRQRRSTGVVPTGLRRVVALAAIPELSEHAGAEDDAEPWHGAVDRGVRVLLKRGLQGGLEFLDAAVDLADLPDGRTVLAANALLTAAGASSCGERSTSRTSAARRSMLRWRPPRLSAERIWVLLSRRGRREAVGGAAARAVEDR